MARNFIRPIKRFVLLLDEQPERTENGVAVKDLLYKCTRLDYTVVRVGTNESCEFGQGDVVILYKPDAGRRLAIDGIVYRLVKLGDIIAVMRKFENDEGK